MGRDPTGGIRKDVREMSVSGDVLGLSLGDGSIEVYYIKVVWELKGEKT